MLFRSLSLSISLFDSNPKIMSTTTMTGINTAQHIVQSLNSPVRADEDNKDNLINSEAMDELREIDRRMVRQVYGERSLSLVAGSFFPPAKSEAGSGSWEWNETNPDSPLNISSLFPSNKSETDSNPEFSRSNHQLSICSYSHCFPPDRSDTDSYGSSTPKQFSMPSLHFPPNKSETINSSLVINGISVDEWILGGIKMDKCIEAIDILQSNCVLALMFYCTDVRGEIYFNRTLLNFGRAVALEERPRENLLRILDKYDEMAEAMEQLDDDSVIYKMLTGLDDVASKTVKPQTQKGPKHNTKSIQVLVDFFPF